MFHPLPTIYPAWSTYQKTMERSTHFLWEHPLFLWPPSIANCLFTSNHLGILTGNHGLLLLGADWAWEHSGVPWVFLRKFTGIPPFFLIWLVVDLPHWKIWVRQLGWLFPIYGKIKKSTPPTSHISLKTNRWFRMSKARLTDCISGPPEYFKNINKIVFKNTDFSRPRCLACVFCFVSCSMVLFKKHVLHWHFQHTQWRTLLQDGRVLAVPATFCSLLLWVKS